MCCLFGIIDYGQSFSGKQKSKMLSVLARACEARGTDATGIAYLYNKKMRIYKRPLPARKMRFHIPDGVSVIMTHTADYAGKRCEELQQSSVARSYGGWHLRLSSQRSAVQR